MGWPERGSGGSWRHGMGLTGRGGTGRGGARVRSDSTENIYRTAVNEGTG